MSQHPTMEHLITFGGNDRLLAKLLECRVRFLVVGGLAVRFYVPEREVDDLDLLLEQSNENADRFFKALAELSYKPLFSKSHIGAPRKRTQQLQLKTREFYADIVTFGKDIDFTAEWAQPQEGFIGPNRVRFASRELLIKMKRKAGREKDLLDIRLLEGGG